MFQRPSSEFSSLSYGWVSEGLPGLGGGCVCGWGGLQDLAGLSTAPPPSLVVGSPGCSGGIRPRVLMPGCCLGNQMGKLTPRGARLLSVSTGQLPRSGDSAVMEVGHSDEGPMSLSLKA